MISDMTAPLVFGYFLELPLELQRMVWLEAAVAAQPVPSLFRLNFLPWAQFPLPDEKHFREHPEQEDVTKYKELTLITRSSRRLQATCTDARFAVFKHLPDKMTIVGRTFRYNAAEDILSLPDWNVVWAPGREPSPRHHNSECLSCFYANHYQHLERAAGKAPAQAHNIALELHVPPHIREEAAGWFPTEEAAPVLTSGYLRWSAQFMAQYGFAWPKCRFSLAVHPELGQDGRVTLGRSKMELLSLLIHEEFISHYYKSLRETHGCGYCTEDDRRKAAIMRERLNRILGLILTDRQGGFDEIIELS